MIKVLKKPVLTLLIFAVLSAAVFLAQGFYTSKEAVSISTRSTPLEVYGLGLTRDDFTSYTHPDNGLTFTVPNDFIVTTFLEDDGEVIVAQHPHLNLALQVFISPFHEDGAITIDRIYKENPSLPLAEPLEFNMEDGTPAVRFRNDDPELGDVRQIWFVRDGTLYQVVLSSDDQEWLDSWVREMYVLLTFTDPDTIPAL